MWCYTVSGWANCECDHVSNLLDLNEWKSYYGFYRLFILNLEYYDDDSDLVRLSKPKELDWTTKAVGSFFIKNLNNIKNKCGKEWITKINQLFTERVVDPLPLMTYGLKLRESCRSSATYDLWLKAES